MSLNNKKKRYESKLDKSKLIEKFPTHIYLHDKYLNAVPKIPHLHSVVVLYLYNNEIAELTNLESAINLTSLYLQNNRLLKIQNLHKLKRLKKLYLGQNTISVVEGLVNIECLEELHVEKQHLSAGNSLCFDPRSMLQISMSLQVLNISGNKIQTLSSLAPLRVLTVLNASHNELDNFEEICGLVKGWVFIKDLNFSDNPIVKNRLYNENIIASAYCLKVLDTKAVSEKTRMFLKKFHKDRISNNLKKPMKALESISYFTKNYPVSIQKLASASMIEEQVRQDTEEIFDERNAVFLPWKSLPKFNSFPKLKKLKSKMTISKKSICNNFESKFKDLAI